MVSTDAFDLMADQLRDTDAQWSLGTFGAVAEFTRDAHEPAELTCGENMISIVTVRGGLRLTTPRGLRPIAFETITTQGWSQRIAFCLPKADSAMARRNVLTELNPDHQALRAGDREALLFDLGLDLYQADACIRTADPVLIAALRAAIGRPLFAPGNTIVKTILSASPHRVFITRCGRTEVYQPIPPHGGVSPHGPHTHVLPRLLARGRTHAATEPIPSGWTSCAHLYPAHPMHGGQSRARLFDADRHAAFQSILERYGDSECLRLKRNVTNAVVAGRSPSSVTIPKTKFARSCVRIALRQARALNFLAPSLDAWIEVHDVRRDPIDASAARIVASRLQHSLACLSLNRPLSDSDECSHPTNKSH